MMVTAQELREHLEARDLAAFANAYEHYLPEAHSTERRSVTQNLLPTILRQELAAGRVSDEVVVHLARLIASGRLLLVEYDLLEELNARVQEAWKGAARTGASAPPRLNTAPRTVPHAPHSLARSPVLGPSAKVDANGLIPMRRIVLASVFRVGPTRLSDTFVHARNLCASSQEREFLRAVRQYFANLRAYPNVPLGNCIDLDALRGLVSERHFQYARAAQVDVLLCTEDEDPVAGIELDSVMHDTEEAHERDALKDELFAQAQLPLVRIRAEDTGNVRAEDFYNLLCAEGEVLDRLRPRRLRPRRNHDMLVPDEVLVRRSAVYPAP